MKSGSVFVAACLSGLCAACGGDGETADDRDRFDWPAAGGERSSGGAPPAASGGVAPAGGGAGGTAIPDQMGGARSGGEPGAPEGPARYDHDRTESRVTRSVAARLAEIASAAERHNNVFMKVGASGTVSKNLLYCFAGDAQPQYTLDLAGRTELLSAIEFFRQGEAAGSTPFDRATLAAVVGRTATWAITGSPSPLEQEMAALDPRFAIVNYGTIDMGMAVSYGAALRPFYESMSTLLDQLEQAGIIPIVSGLNPRTDRADAARWVSTYDVVTRGLAEQRQLPYISLYLLNRDLPDAGLVADGVHGNAYWSGGPEPCVFTRAALEYSYNGRNLATIAALDRVKRVVVDAEPATDVASAPAAGTGTTADPIVIDRLPFTHSVDTLQDGSRELDSYACGTQNEAGPELVYRLDLSRRTSIRVVVLDREDVDIDIHLLGSTPTGDSCLDRDDSLIQTTLDAGVYHVVADTFVSQSEGERGGRYLLAVLPCESGDPDCE